jgi:hypothetical protein
MNRMKSKKPVKKHNVRMPSVKEKSWAHISGIIKDEYDLKDKVVLNCGCHRTLIPKYNF